MKGAMIRCATGRNVLASEHEQKRCNGDETALGAVAYGWCTDAGQAIFGSSRKRSGLDYQTALDELASKGDLTAKAARVAKASLASVSLLEPATAAPSAFRFPRATRRRPNLRVSHDVVHQGQQTPGSRASGSCCA
jgi:hypothetical protein